MARAIDETRKTLITINTFYNTIILIKKLSLKIINQNNHYLQNTYTIIIYTIKILNTYNHN